MLKSTPPAPLAFDETARDLRLEMRHLQATEGNPLRAGEIAIFEMFEREGRSHDRCLLFRHEVARWRAA